MIKEIEIDKKYKVKNSTHTRTPLLVHNTYVFYEHDYHGYASCAHCCIDDFLKDTEEIPETPEIEPRSIPNAQLPNFRTAISTRILAM